MVQLSEERRQQMREADKRYREANRLKVREAARLSAARGRRKRGIPLSGRSSSTKIEIEERRVALYEIVEAQRPMTIRQVFYRATVKGLVDKDELGYESVQRNLTAMRRSGMLPYDWITDSTRFRRVYQTFENPQVAIEEVARFYRKSALASADAHIEFWIEKDALSGVVFPITSRYDVPLMVARGYSSLTFLHESAEFIESIDKPTYIYQLGDHDPSGANAAEVIERDLREMAPSSEIFFERLAVLPHQIEEWSLPTRPTKESDLRSKNFVGDSVELDAIEPDQLRQLVQDAIEEHISPKELATIREAEKSERAMIRGLVGMIG